MDTETKSRDSSPPIAAVAKSQNCAPVLWAHHPWGGTRYTSWTTPPPRRLTGQIEDAAIGLYFYNARYYDSALGRFIQADTIVPSPANPQSLNRYAYVLNNPLRYTDPTGHAHYNPGDGSDSTKPKVCYSYSYPQAETQPSQISVPMPTSTPVSPPWQTPTPFPTPSLGELLSFTPQPQQPILTAPGYPREVRRYIGRYRRDLSKIDWPDMGVGALGIAGDLGLFGGGPEAWALTEMVEYVGYGLDVEDLVNGDYFGVGQTITEKTIEAFALIPGIGGLGNMVDMLIALSKGYVPVIYIEYEDGTSLPLED